MKHALTDIYTRLFERFGPQRWWPGDTPLEVAVGAVLTQNTNWGNVERAIGNLKAARALSVRRLHAMPHAGLASLIRPAGYFNVKARRLKHFVAYLVERHGGSMARMRRAGHGLRDELLGVNGIGKETADSILLYALGKPFFVIDAYTKRALSRHGILTDAHGYDDYQRLFMDSLPEDVGLFNEYHALFVALGKHLCRPRNPLCSECPLEGMKFKRTA